jgi:Na+/H+ antiporter NhaA
MMSADAQVESYGGRTAWARNLAAPVRDFLGTETGGAAVMLGAAVIALAWANSPWSHSYESVWTTKLTIGIPAGEISTSLRTWVNEGLMTLFFLVVGLEARREIALGELRERRRIAIPVVAAIGGMVIPIAIYLGFNAGGHGAHGWGAAMSSDTAFALASVALLTPRTATRLRVFLLSAAVVDDLAGLVVIAIAYTHHLSVVALAIALGLFGLLIALRFAPFGRTPVFIIVAVALWVATYKSGIDPVVTGLAIGLATSAYTPARDELERATALTRSFREQPTPELARSAQRGLLSTISPNERLQYDLHPWTSYVIVPLFALANAGVHVTGNLLSAAATSPITLGILVGYVVGKPVGIGLGSWLATRPSLRGPRPLVSQPVVAVGGACAGVGFTVSILIASLAFTGKAFDEARLGTLATIIVSPALGWVFLRVLQRLPTSVRARQLSGTAEPILDLADDVDPERDHIRGPDDAPVTLVEYGDFQCPYCGQAEQVIRELLTSQGDDIRYVWRHLPLNDVHPFAQLASEASEAAAAQGKFWDMYDLLLANQDALLFRHLLAYADQLGLDLERFEDALRTHKYADRITEDVVSADESGVTGTPTFFINGRRHWGVYDLDTLTREVNAAKYRERLVQKAATQDGSGELERPAGVAVDGDGGDGAGEAPA